MLLQFLTIVLPQVPGLTNMFREAFKSIGGNEADFDAILAKNQIDIDRLADPDSFRHKKAGTPAPPPPVTGAFPYGEVLDAKPDKSSLVEGRDIVYTGPHGKFVVWGGVGHKPNDGFPDPGGWNEITDFWS